MINKLSMMESYSPYTAYRNLPAFIKARRLITDHKWLDREKFIQEIQLNGYINIMCEDEPDRYRRTPLPNGLPLTTCIAIMDRASPQIEKTDSFIKFLKSIPQYKKPTENLDILVLTESEISPHILRRVEQDSRAIPADAPRIRIQFHKYDKFKVDQTRHILAAQHSVLTSEEEANLLTREHITKDQLPKITRDDAKCLWIGAEPGEVVRIVSPAETTIARISYRLVRP